MLDLYKTHVVLCPSGVMELLRKLLTPKLSRLKRLKIVRESKCE